VRRLLRSALGALIVVLASLWWLSRPVPLAPKDLPEHTPDLVNGERLFDVGGCASCHGEDGEGGRSRDRLGGGLLLASRYGDFHVPNISPHPEHGIGGWTRIEFANAMLRGLAPDGRHFYPSFPYPSYARMSVGDVLDLKAYLDRLPPVATPSGAHRLGFPWSVRRALGLWKRLYLDAAPVRPAASADAALARGRYLVEGPGHCGECHTPRGWLGGPQLDKWLTGAPALDGQGRVPGITGGERDLGGWSGADIVYYLESGIDPDFDVVGGDMVAVQENLARLPAADREAIARYLKSLE
jgi:mono/diheme cytochrome c family protein